MTAQTLVLNATYEAIDVVPWQRAMTLWVGGKVEIVASHDQEARAVTFTFKLPSVVRLLRFARIRHRKTTVPFCRANIFTRDNYTCQYCGTKHEPDELTFDHVIPASQGGRRSWDNIATACVDCNRLKGARTLEESGMTLRKQPVMPKPSPVFSVTIGIRKTPEAWRDYMYWNAELEA